MWHFRLWLSKSLHWYICELRRLIGDDSCSKIIPDLKSRIFPHGVISNHRGRLWVIGDKLNARWRFPSHLPLQRKFPTVCIISAYSDTFQSHVRGIYHLQWPRSKMFYLLVYTYTVVLTFHSTPSLPTNNLIGRWKPMCSGPWGVPNLPVPRQRSH